MNSSQADNIVSGAVLGILIMGMADDYIVKDEKPPFKFFMGVAVTGAALAYTADINPEIAAWLAIIIFVVVLLEEGAPALKALQESKTVGEVTESGTTNNKATEFPVIPFTKTKGKRKPTIIKKLKPLPIKAPAPQRIPLQHEGILDKPAREAVEAAKKFLEKIPLPKTGPGGLPPIQDLLPELG